MRLAAHGQLSNLCLSLDLPPSCRFRLPDKVRKLSGQVSAYRGGQPLWKRDGTVGNQRAQCCDAVGIASGLVGRLPRRLDCVLGLHDSASHRSANRAPTLCASGLLLLLEGTIP